MVKLFTWNKMEIFLHLLANQKTKMLVQNNLFHLNLTIQSYLYILFIKLMYLNYKTKPHPKKSFGINI